MTPQFTPDQRAEIEAYAKSLIEEAQAVEATIPERAQAAKRQRVETAVNSTVSSLTPQQRTFLIEYLISNNATAAAREAGYKHPNKDGPRLRKEPFILAAIDEYFDGQGMTEKEIVARISELARGAHTVYYRLDGNRIYVDAAALLTDGREHLIHNVKETPYGQQVEFHNMLTALELAGRVRGIFTDRTDITTGGKPLPTPAYIVENRPKNDNP